jgi:aspartyl-tRNA(Asn)/glutamyl-tRNA(Gln) amidotransferase subunit B
MELVTEPVIHSAEEAGAFAREFQLLLRYLNVSDADMEKGQMRVEVNISLQRNFQFPRPRRSFGGQVGGQAISNFQTNPKSKIHPVIQPDVRSDDRTNSKLGLNQSEGLIGRTDLPNKSVLGTKVEIKNLNSFRVAEKAIEYETKRQTEMLEKGEKIVQETRGWDEKAQKTFSQREKESSHDYRYFPDPDLPKLKLHEIFNLEDLKNALPELPWQKRDRLKKFNISDEGVEIFVQNTLIGNYFESVISSFHNNLDTIKLASNYITSDILSHLKSKPDATLPAPVNVSRLIEMIVDGEISSRGAKDILEHMHGHDDDPMKIALEKGLLQKSDESALKAIVEKVLAENETVAAEYKQGKEASLQYLIGQIMRATKGSANPQVASKILKEMLR